MKYKFSQTQLEEAIKTSTSIRQVLATLGLVEAGGNYSTLKNRIQESKLDTSHFTGRGWRKDSQAPTVTPKPLESLLQNGTAVQSYKLKNKLFKDGLKQRACENCSLERWMGQEIALELDHINGNKHDNRLENLRVLCPNCHAMTSTYRGKNKKLRVHL